MKPLVGEKVNCDSAQQNEIGGGCERKMRTPYSEVHRGEIILLTKKSISSPKRECRLRSRREEAAGGSSRGLGRWGVGSGEWGTSHWNETGRHCQVRQVSSWDPAHGRRKAQSAHLLGEGRNHDKTQAVAESYCRHLSLWSGGGGWEGSGTE